MAKKTRIAKRKSSSPDKLPQDVSMSMTVPKRRGRPAVTDIPLLTSVITQFKERLFNSDGTVVSRSDPVWIELSQSFAEAIQSNGSSTKPKDHLSMYTYVACDKNGIRSELKPQTYLEDSSLSANTAVLENELTNNSAADTSLDLSDTIESNVNSLNFIISIQGCDFDQLTETTLYKDKNRATGTRKRLRFKKDAWSRWCNKKIYSVTRSSCGFVFHYHYINQDGNSGHIAGYCNCGSLVDIQLRRNEENVVSLKCTVTNPEQKKKCSKVYLRGEERKTIASTLQTTSTFKYRTEKLGQLMNEIQKFEPSVIPNAQALRTAKSEIILRSYLDADPLKAVQKMKLTSMKNIIYNIGLSPVFVHYSTKHQDTTYKTLAERENVSIAIDATGSIIRKIRHPDKSESGPIFLYAAVVRTVSYSCIIAQMISEKHNTTAITHWLNEWICNTESPCPKEVVCDSSKALLAACVRSFTTLNSISVYANALAGDVMPPCYIRIDVAHFIKNYANSLKGTRHEVRKFYLSCIGRLIISENIEEAKNIIYALFVVSLSDNDGPTASQELSECEKQKNYLMELLTNSFDENLVPSNTMYCDNDDCDVFDENSQEKSSNSTDDNQWTDLGNTLLQMAYYNIQRLPGTRVNAHRLKIFFKRLIEDLKLLPLWSCIVRNKFGYGRVPATSAHVESEFNKIKNILLAHESLPMRLDAFIKLHVDHLNGVLKQFNVLVSNENHENEIHQTTLPSSSSSSLSICDDSNSVLENSPNTSSVTSTRKCMLCKLIIKDLSSDFLKSDYNNLICNDCNNALNQPPILKDITQDLCNKCNQQSGICNTESEPVFLERESISSTILTISNRCPACQQGDIPSGSHTCIVCGVFVHALDLCSKPYGDEGYGQTRICNKCSAQTNVDQIIESREQENWRGQILKSSKKQAKSKNCYLKKRFSSQTFASKSELQKIPILKKGDNKRLKAVRDGQQKIDYINTCAFDALFQLFLVTSNVVPTFFENFVKKFSDANSFCYLVTKSKDKITAQSYLLRADILKNLFPKRGNDELQCYMVDCSTTIKELTQKLLQGVPSFVERTRCQKSHEKLRKHTSLNVTKSSLISMTPDKLMEQDIIIDSSKCLICSSIETTSIEVAENFVLLAIVPGFDQNQEKEIDPDILLRDIPLKLKLSFMNEPFYLRGLIHFQSAHMTTRTTRNLEKQDLGNIGHYTTFYNRNGKWAEFDGKEIKRPDGFAVNPELIMYSRD